jgi:hypothetical protein
MVCNTVQQANRWKCIGSAFILAFSIAVVCVPERLRGQVPYSESVARDHVVPNPNSLLACLAFARHDSVKRFLNLDAEQTKWVDELLLETGGTPATYTISFDAEIEINQDVRNQIRENGPLIVAEREAKALEVLDPQQRDRLRFVTLFMEVKRAGIRESLMTGFVGDELGINQGQRQAIENALVKLDEQKRAELIALGKKIEDDLTSELSLEQQCLWRKIVGKDFRFVETEKEKRRNRVMAAMGRKPFVPNPAETIDLIPLLQRSDVAEELEMTEEQVSAFKNASRTRASTKWVNSLLTNKQQVRAKELVFRYEVFCMGVHKALSEGHLGKALGITKSQAEPILKRIPEHQSHLPQVLLLF